jgi:ApeA-like protein/HEPN superfamily Apea-like protein
MERRVWKTMTNEPERKTSFGTFLVESDRDVFGELILDGQNSSLYLQDKKPFEVRGKGTLSINGTLRDLTKASLLNCICTATGTSGIRGTEGYHFAEVLPEFVILGDKHFTAEDAVIQSMSFVVDDAATIFYDFDLFGRVFDDPETLVRKIVEANEKKFKRKIEIGPYPEIYYYTGKQEIFSTPSVIGTVSATHAVSHSSAGPKGIRVDNSIIVNVRFPEPVVFQRVIHATHALLHFLDIIAGRPQNLNAMTIVLESTSDFPSIQRVHRSKPPRREIIEGERKPNSIEVLIDAVKNPKEFGGVLTEWLSRQEIWKDARERFWLAFSQQRTYGHDRLIGAANLFDIMPSSAFPPPKELPDDIREAIEESRRIFRKLPDSIERQGVLGELGRVGKSKLKAKIRHRAMPISQRLPTNFPELTLVTDEAVNCRNYYVHGGSASIDYSNNFWLLVFLSNTLEFVFAASDLIDAGWDLSKWVAKGSTLSHPFAVYLHTYRESLARLKALRNGDVLPEG